MALGTKEAFERRMNEFERMAKRKPHLAGFVRQSLQEIKADMARLNGVGIDDNTYAFMNGWLTGVLDFNS